MGSQNVDQRPLSFKWTDGSLINPKFWALHQPDNSEKNCLVLDGHVDFYLERKACYFENHFICELEVPDSTCTNGWSFIEGNYCLKYFLNDNKNYTEAQKTCAIYKANLLTLNDNTFKLSRVQAYLKMIKLNEYEKYFWVS